MLTYGSARHPFRKAHYGAPPKNILAPTDFSAAGDHAVQWAAELAAAAIGARVNLLHVCQPPISPEAADLALLASGKVEHAGLESLQRRFEPYAGKVARGELMVLLGDPRAEIMRAAKQLGCDLIVMGTHGRRGFKRMVLGSVAEAVVRSAPCPVLTVHPPEPRREPRGAPRRHAHASLELPPARSCRSRPERC